MFASHAKYLSICSYISQDCHGKKRWERFARRYDKYQLSTFCLANPFFTYLNTIYLKIFHDHRRIYRFPRKQNLWRDENSMGSIEIEDVSVKVILKNCSINWQLLKICWSWPGGWKRGTTHYVIWELIYRFCCISEYFVDPNIT